MAKGIPYIVYQNMSAEEKEVAKWRAEKEKAARKLRAAERVVECKRSTAHYNVVIAAKAVVANWSKKELAESVRDLDRALQNYHEVVK